jgi:hypothetical protein
MYLAATVFMQAQKVLLDGLASTTLMTLFSYTAAEGQGRNYKEPVLLAGAMEAAGVRQPLSTLGGWTIHYGLGVVWSAVIRVFLRKMRLKPRVLTGVFMGTIGGLVGVACWKPVVQQFRLLPNRQARRFYSHLVLAHVLFTVALMKEMQKADAGKR